MINADVAGALWDTSPKEAKDGSRRGATGLAEELLLSERNPSLALRVHELRRGGFTEDKAVEKVVEKVNAIEKAKEEHSAQKSQEQKSEKQKDNEQAIEDQRG